MPPDKKKEPIENLKDTFRSAGLKDARGEKNPMPFKAHFSTWHHLFCYGKERSRFNSVKKEVI